ncbi:MAG TPA: XTP/dITP diphosphatase [Pyrinomonadaceae bacterium]|jgi:XTP/dITP diphosphohydrolase|nr:XTP/dITP diphosphatase [Pyrinomonadaceae bacterium]
MKLLVATNNAGKIKELDELLADLPIRLFGLRDFENTFEPEETGATFADNAVLKANSYALQTGFWALSDDSGLEVEALNGAPGVFSARYAGENANDQERIVKLLDELTEKGGKSRRARFVCAMAIADETGEIKFQAEGICDGKIALKPRGTNGFGYDPIFVPEGYEQTFGELSSAIKGKISHRAQAIGKIMRFLRSFTQFYGS